MRKYIKIITISGLFILVLIQIIWLYSSYQFNKNEIVFKTSNLLENAIDAETFSRLSSLSSTYKCNFLGADNKQ